MPSPARDHIVQQVHRLLQERRVVVWYDQHQELASVFESLRFMHLEKVDARTSVLTARRLADRHWTFLSDASLEERHVQQLLIYVPWVRAKREEDKLQEPFEAYALIGAAFGADPGHALDALAREAMPERKAEVDRLFASPGRPTLDQLEALSAKAGYPLLKQALGTEDPIEVAARVIAERSRVLAASGAAGVGSEILRLLREAFGFQSSADLPTALTVFARWVLFSEFAFDIDGKVPAHTARVERAGGAYQATIYALCDRLRSTQPWRETYMEVAAEAQDKLTLEGIAEELSSWGERDTFPVEDTAALRFVQAMCLAEKLVEARRTLDLRKRSIWLEEPWRAQLWQLATRALELLEAIERWRAVAPTSARSTREHTVAYTAETTGLWQVDRAQRRMESAAGDCVERELLQPLFERAQLSYRQVIDAAQGAFIEAVVRDGWPPEGPLQTQVFAKHVAPSLQEGVRVAYFLLDALRFEMGHDLREGLERLGTVQVERTATVVPAKTLFGMAALLPGAETSFGCELRNGELVPVVSGKPMVTVDDRKSCFREQLGDRCVDLRLDDLLDDNEAKLKERVGRASLLVVRSDDIDKAGEGTNLPSARRFMASILTDVATVAQRLARLGVTRMVFASDHGHVLLPEVLAGDAVKAPPGEWLLSTRRCRLGSAAGQADGVRILPAARVGIHGPVKDVAICTGFRVFTAGAGYFHEGMSLQECLVPTVTLEVRAELMRREKDRPSVTVSYRHPQYTQRIFVVKLMLKLANMLEPEVDVRVVAMAGDHQVGQAADCDARDPATKLVRLRANVEEPVAIRIDDDFTGPEVEVRVLDAGGTGVVLGSKKLKNGSSE
jgi:hypothetical protein